jgi:hypothetical protein
MSLYNSANFFRPSGDERELARPLEQTEPTQQMVDDLMQHVRAQFYTIWPDKRWLQEQKAILGILTWPATWLNQRGISLPLPKYEAILREVIVGIQRHGATADIKFFPAYLEKAIKAWFIHNGEALYEDRKSIRNALDMRFLKGLTPEVPKAPDPIDILAQANRVLATAKRRPKAAKTDDLQRSLF